MTLKVKKSTVAKLFVALGYKSAEKWDEERLQKKIKELPELVEDETVVSGAKNQSLLSALLKAKKVILSDKDEGISKRDADEHKKLRQEEKAEKAEKEEKAAVTKKSKKVAKKTAKKSKKTVKKTAKKSKKAAKKKTEKELDKFGSTVGSTNAKVNKVLKKTPQTMQQIMKAVGSSSSFYTHISSLIKQKKVVKTEKGYKLT